MRTEPNDSAYPVPQEAVGNGLTKREYFAAMAMQGIVSEVDPRCHMGTIGRLSVVCADALIAELNKEKSE